MTTADQLRRIFDVYALSDGAIRPNFILSGETGSSKTWTIQTLADELEIDIVEINCAQLTNEGISGNSVSKEMARTRSYQGQLCIVFFDEFDKLFLPQEETESSPMGTLGIQNELLRIVESDTTSVYGDYAKYKAIDVSRFLFVFAGAFGGQCIEHPKQLIELGVRPEFVGRVPLTYHMNKVPLEALIDILEGSELIDEYLNVIDGFNRDEVVKECSVLLEQAYDRNLFGARIINGIIHQYFINDGDTSKVTLTSMQPPKTTAAKKSSKHKDLFKSPKIEKA